eukprot:g4916.t1
MEMIRNVANKVIGEVKFPAIGEAEDIKKAQEIVGEDATIYAALRTPPEYYTLTTSDYCKLCLVPCFYPPVITASKTMENSLYIVTDKEVKVHVDPFQPPLCVGAPSRELPKLDFKDVSDVKVVRKGGTCFDPVQKTGLQFGTSGIEFYISEPEKLEELIEKAKKLSGGVTDAVAKAESIHEQIAGDEGQSSAVL